MNRDPKLKCVESPNVPPKTMELSQKLMNGLSKEAGNYDLETYLNGVLHFTMMVIAAQSQMCDEDPIVFAERAIAALRANLYALFDKLEEKSSK